jgi:hypothetical protein
MEVITANNLGDGRVVFQTASGWVHDIDGAEILEGKDAVAAAIARANADAALNRVVDPYAITVIRQAGRLAPTKIREAIRANGPTTGNSTSAYHPVREKAA